MLSRKPTKLKMTPKKRMVKKFIANIEVEFAKGDDSIDSVKIVDPLIKGDTENEYTLYTFTNTKLDTGVKDDVFKIKKGD